MAKAKQDAVWVTLEVDTLENGQRAAYEAYKAAYREMKAKREAFEKIMADTAGLKEGERMIFGYNFGKLSVAVVADDRVAKPKATTKSLAEYLRERANG